MKLKVVSVGALALALGVGLASWNPQTRLEG